eukprot:m51a1_g6333 putative cell division cycle protein 48 homolog (198) ;mRNA; f:17625-18328
MEFVLEDADGDNSVLSLHPTKAEQLGVFRGDIVILKRVSSRPPCASRSSTSPLASSRLSTPGATPPAALARETPCIALLDEHVPLHKVRANGVVRANICARAGDAVVVVPVGNVPSARCVEIVPLADTLDGVTSDLFESFLKPYFRDAWRPVRVGDRFTCKGGLRMVEFEVLLTDPMPMAVVAPETVIFCDGDPVNR